MFTYLNLSLRLASTETYLLFYICLEDISAADTRKSGPRSLNSAIKYMYCEYRGLFLQMLFILLIPFRTKKLPSVINTSRRLINGHV